jgi:hypothetical protein
MFGFHHLATRLRATAEPCLKEQVMRTAPSKNAKLLDELEIEFAIAKLPSLAIENEFKSLFDQLKSASQDEETWIIAMTVGLWRDWNRAHRSHEVKCQEASTEMERAETCDVDADQLRVPELQDG